MTGARLAIAWMIALGAATPLLAGSAGIARAAEPDTAAAAPRDTALGGYLRTLTDSTDRWFGRSAEPTDTEGLDTLQGTPLTPRGRALSFGGYPRFGFNRVDGSTPGFTLKAEAPHPWGGLAARAGWALSSHQRRGSLEYENTISRGALSGLHVRVRGGRETAGMNRDRPGGFLTALQGFLYGSDDTHYLRRDGVEGLLEVETVSWRLGAGYRDELESALRATTSWNLLGRDLSVPWNLAAATGRVHETELAGGLRLPFVPVRAEGTWQSSGPALGSAFRYDRWRFAAGSDLSLGRSVSVVPQVMFGRVTGAVPPQAAFYLGGGSTLRSLHRDELGGTGAAVGRIDLIGARDVLSMLHIRHSDALRITPAAFAAIGAAWGADPYRGSPRDSLPAIAWPRGGDAWPDRNDWISEAGAGLHYDIGAFGTRLAAIWVVPLGPTLGRSSRFVIDLASPLSLLRAPREP